MPVRRESHGPLRLLKGHLPEGPQVWHQTIVHPPGGVVGGDALDIRVAVGPGAHALVTTPSSTKWYRSAGPVATQQLRLDVADGGLLEWLPQDNIVFSGAHVRWHTALQLHGNARLLAAELTCLGRPGAGEDFDAGSLRWTTTLEHDGRLLFAERAVIDGQDHDRTDGWRAQPVLGDCTACGMLLAFDARWLERPADHAAAVNACREAVLATDGRRTGEEGSWGVTGLPGLVVVRWRGNQAQTGWMVLRSAWAGLRPSITGRPAVAPRIWAT